jgi:hypothetical protein
MLAATVKPIRLGIVISPDCLAFQCSRWHKQLCFWFLLSYLESVQTVVLCRFWFRCSRGLRRRLSAVHLLEARVRIPPREWLSVVRSRSLPRADSSSREVPPNAACLSVIMKPRGEGSGPLGAAVPWGGGDTDINVPSDTSNSNQNNSVHTGSSQIPNIKPSLHSWRHTRLRVGQHNAQSRIYPIRCVTKNFRKRLLASSHLSVSPSACNK